VCNQDFALFSPFIISKFPAKVDLARKFFILGDVSSILESFDYQYVAILDVFPRCKRRLFVLQKTAFCSLKDYVSILQNNRNRNTKSRLLQTEESEAAVKN